MNLPARLLGTLGLLLAMTAPLTPSLRAASDDSKAAAVTPVYTATETAPFKALITSTLERLGAGDKAGMTTKLTDLETAWDDAEKNLRGRDEATWTSIDKTLDKAITCLRSSKYDETKGKKALDSMNGKLDQATKK
jgi:hypothetical protein